MRSIIKGSFVGRTVIFALVGIHLILPFTPVNRHPEGRIIIASLIIGIVFLGLGLLSFRKQFISFFAALILLIIVIAVSALSGASPLQEGIIVKIVLVAGLMYGTIYAKILK